MTSVEPQDARQETSNDTDRNTWWFWLVQVIQAISNAIRKNIVVVIVLLVLIFWRVSESDWASTLEALQWLEMCLWLWD